MSIKATRSDPEHLPCVVEVIGADIYNLALTGDKACNLTSEGWTSTGTCPEEQSPTLTCTHYGEPAVAYGVTTKGKRVETNTCFSQLTIIQDVTGAMENQLGWGIKQSETMYTINGTQISGVAYLIARLDNAEVL